MIAERDGALVAVEFGGDRAAMLRTVAGPGGGARLAWTDGTDSPARRQLAEYFAGRRREFELPLAPRGTPFQLEVWAALRTIPFGSTCSYADIAARIGRPNAVRAVGAANGRNPIAIIVPCHRVIGRDGSLTGYAGGLDRKRRLLQHERTVPGPKPTCGF
ncbi:MAG: methylated-DNA--[protein]-cysteine S-methyltransferase [Planctomycetes bacterium]|nr:methylated-DNA--[protein]-cysteine S-methyltransferase [Planctomycetota bacterium]